MEWVNEHKQQFVRQVPVRSQMPPDFLRNEQRALIFRVNPDDVPTVGFRMKLSELTTKELFHPETEAEKIQRQRDEALWVALQAKDVNGVRAALAQGANVQQPWLEKIPYSSDFVGNSALFRYAVWKAQNPDIVDALLKQKPALRGYLDTPQRSLVWETTLYNMLDVAQVLLRHGSDPNSIGVTDYDLDLKLGQRRRPNERVLYLAAERPIVPLVKALLAHGARTDFMLSDGMPFMNWVRTKATPEVRALLIKPQQIRAD